MDHDYDGIREYDNRLPNWWLWILFGSIIFSLGYWLFFHTFGIGKLSAERYEAEMIAAAEARLGGAGELSDESLILASSIPDRVEAGRQLYAQHCVACHATQGEGLVGPNLTDAYWIHGGRPMDIYKTISEGVIAKGMAAWERQLGPQRVQTLAAYVLTLRGKNLPGKAPEGQPFTE
jgi:cytochrome c oxidase cbb3-type subunit 3